MKLFNLLKNLHLHGHLLVEKKIEDLLNLILETGFQKCFFVCTVFLRFLIIFLTLFVWEFL